MTVIAKSKYPARAISQGVPGKDFLVYVNYGENATPSAPVWNLLGGTNNDNLGISAEVSTNQTKSSGYWQEGSITGKSGEYNTEMVVLRDNLAQQVIEEFIYNDEITDEKQALHMAIVDKVSKDYKEFWAAPTTWELASESGELATYNFAATIVGAPLKKTGFSLGDTSEVTFDKTNPADVVFTVSGATITGLKNGTTAVTSSNYSIAAGGQSIVISSDYLETLTNGDVTFNVLLSDGGSIAHVVTITATS